MRHEVVGLKLLSSLHMHDRGLLHLLGGVSKQILHLTLGTLTEVLIVVGGSLLLLEHLLLMRHEVVGLELLSSLHMHDRGLLHLLGGVSKQILHLTLGTLTEVLIVVGGSLLLLEHFLLMRHEVVGLELFSSLLMHNRGLLHLL